MKQLIGTVLVCALAAGVSAQTKKPMPKRAAADELMAAENKLIDDVTRHDANAFFAAIAPGSWSLDENGWMNLDDFRKSWDQVKVESSKTSEMKVIPLGANAAIVTYKLDQKGSFMGQPFPPTTYATTVWEMKRGKWMAVFHQESAAATKK